MRKLVLLTAFVLGSVGVWAQGVTTATLVGTVTAASDVQTPEKRVSAEETLPGATVLAVHMPSGTQYGTSVNANGRFVIQNMRVGGPYKVTISFVGYQTREVNDIYLKLGEPFNLNVSLVEDGKQLDEVVVLGTQDRLLNSDRNGAVTSISTREIQNMPSISRSINDFTRFTPQASSSSNGAIGGGNYRQNYITVDGSDFNNTFGIGSNLPAGGSPISLDALEEISVNITPYDIRQANFVGSAINAITRSGTNEFSGSAYTFWRSQRQQGNDVGFNAPFLRQKQSIFTTGVRIGGPIIKNKLFFFFNYENTNETRPGQNRRAATPAAPFGSSPEISRPLASELDAISQYLRENYGYETGPYENYDNESNNRRYVARLDWNINQNHRLSIRYSQVESKRPGGLSGSTSGSNFNFTTGLGRLNNTALFFQNATYFQEENFYSLAAEVNSLFGKISNTFRATYTKQNDPRSSDGGVFPFVDILDGTGAYNAGTGISSGAGFTSFGFEPFSFGNLRAVETYSIVDFATMNVGIHNITAGFQADFQTTQNGFQRFGTGHYVFNTWNDFVNGANPLNYAITYSLLPGYEQAFPNIKYNQYSVYGQDEIAVNDRLKVTAGIRFDLPTFPSTEGIQTHPLVAPLTFADGRILDSGVLPKTRVMVSPRIGFNWDVLGDRSLQVRGGTGIFTGRVPTVWLVAQSGDAGLLQFTQAFSGQANTPGPFNPDPRAYLPATPPAAGTAIPLTFSNIDPDFKFPQAWKSSIAVDKKLGGGLVASLEGIYTKDLNIAKGVNHNLKDPVALNIAGYPDNRPVYAVATTDRFYNRVSNGQSTPTSTGAWNPITLGNADEGYYWSITGKLEKQFSKGLSAFVAYTRSDAQVLYDGNGDQLFNTWSLNQIVGNPNNPGLSVANYIVPDRIIASVSYRKEFLNKLATSVSVFWEGAIQGRYSYTYSADINRDGQPNDLIYVPNDPSEIDFADQTYGGVLWTAAQQELLFFRMIEQDKYLSSRRGKYAERNGAKLPWRNQIDVRFAQDIFTNVGGKKNTLQFTLDINNFGNWLNPSWGITRSVNATGILVPRNANSVVSGGTVRPTYSLANDRNQPVSSSFRENNDLSSTYFMQFGLRYIFN